MAVPIESTPGNNFTRVLEELGQMTNKMPLLEISISVCFEEEGTFFIFVFCLFSPTNMKNRNVSELLRSMSG